MHKMFDSLIMVLLYMSLHACASETTKELSSCISVLLGVFGPVSMQKISYILFNENVEGL